MQTKMSSKFRKHLSSPKNASKLTELLIESSKTTKGVSVEVDGKKLTLRQIGVALEG